MQKIQANRKVIFFTNIIAPYRVFLFNELEKVSKENSFDFEVYFMRETESNRDWNIDKNNIRFKYKVGNGLYFRIKSYFGHFNPILIFNLIKNNEEIILGASWNNLNVLLIALLKTCGIIKNKLSIWTEANYMTNESQQKNKFRDILKKWFFSKIDGNFVVPGKMATISFDKWGIPYKNIVIFPNLVNDKVFRREIPYNNYMDQLPIFFIVARLEENIKGIKNFLIAIGLNNTKKIMLRIAGTGASLNEYINYVRTNDLEKNVVFLGNLTEEEISKEYKKSNVFVLPSFSDPSPLTIVEAIHSGLPVLISERCGNHFETVEEGENGYIFDPLDHEETKSKFEKLLENRYLWNKFSEKSCRIANKNFNPQNSLRNFIKLYNK